jgi:hypothetical protein
MENRKGWRSRRMPEPEDLQIELFEGAKERRAGRAGGKAASRRRAVLEVLDKNLRSIWEGDVELYRATTADDVTFYEWYISPDRIDGIDFHLREIKGHASVLAEGGSIEHEILNPRVQFYGSVAIVTYTLMIRSMTGGKVLHRSHHETRVFHDSGSKEVPEWKLVHCHKSPVVTVDSLGVLRG